MAKPPTSVRSIRLPDELWERLSAKAKERGTTVNAAILRAAEDWLLIPDFVVRAGPALSQIRQEALDEACASTDMSAALRDQIARDAKTPAQQMSEREARDAFWRKRGAFNPKGRGK